MGDAWQMTYGPFKVVAVDGGLTVREFPENKQCPNCRYYSDAQSVLVKVVTADRDQASAYSATFFNEASNVTVPLRHTVRVLGYETVQTKAGPLKAFKLTHAREVQHVRSSLSRPDWGTAVRQVLSTGAVRNFGNDYELESYSLK
ncbi:MAG TPA: hypothetical protein VGR82_03045 [Methylomirabilota bacterium]|nr:hypothetical protein [Methylomirabilota bacterium]